MPSGLSATQEHAKVNTTSEVNKNIGVLPLIKELRNAYPRFTQPCYTDEAGAGGTFQQVQEHFRDLQARGPARGYYPEQTKSILVVALKNIARAEEHFRDSGGDRTPLPGRVHQGRRRGKGVDTGQNPRVDRVSKTFCSGRP